MGKEWELSGEYELPFEGSGVERKEKSHNMNISPGLLLRVNGRGTHWLPRILEEECRRSVSVTQSLYF